MFVAGFGALVMGLTWVASRMGGVLAAALALFGAIGGPLLGLFTLGIFVPFVNWIGALSGLLTGLALTLWITVGAQMYKVWVARVGLPFCRVRCPLDDYRSARFTRCRAAKSMAHPTAQTHEPNWLIWWEPL